MDREEGIMKRDILILALLGVFAFVAMPAASPVNAQERDQRVYNQRDQNNDRRHSQSHRTNDWNKHHKKYTHGYRNYGQYRRTQVGNRRFLTTRNSYYRRHHRRNTWNGGVRNN